MNAEAVPTLEALVGEGDPKAIEGLNIHFRSPTLSELPEGLREFAKIIKNIMSRKSGEEEKLQPWEMMEAAADSTENAANLIRLFTTMKQDEVNKLELDVIPEIAFEIVRRNLDFFTKKLLPMAEKITKLMTTNASPGPKSLRG